MQDKEKVAVIIVTHNNADTIVRALESASKNLRPPDIIVIGDNDSTDKTYSSLCKLLGAEMIEQDGRHGWPPKFDGKFNNVPVTIFRKQKSNMAHSLNACLSLTPKDVSAIGFLSAQDWYAPDKIVRSIRILQMHPAIAVAVSDCDIHHADGRVVRSFKRAFHQHVLLESYPYDRNFFIRTTVFSKLKGGFNQQLDDREDYDLLLRASEIGLIYHTPEPLHHCVEVKIKESETICEQQIREVTIQRRSKVVQET